MTAPLQGLRVVESTSYVAGPLAGMTLAQMGAEVIRIDPIRGASDAGRWPLSSNGTSLFWAGLNKGVKSIGVDLSSPAGQEVATALITAPGEDAGLFVDNTVGRACSPTSICARGELTWCTCTSRVIRMTARRWTTR